MNTSQLDFPPPIYIVGENEDSDQKPLFPNKEEDEEELLPILPSPGYIPNTFGNVNNPASPAYPLQRTASSTVNSIRDPDSDGNSMGVLYQSTAGSVTDHQDYRKNDLGSRLNSPLISGRTTEYNLLPLEPLNQDPNRFTISPFSDRKQYQSEEQPKESIPRLPEVGTPFSLFRPTYEYQNNTSTTFPVSQNAYSGGYQTFSCQQPSIFQPSSILAPPTFSPAKTAPTATPTTSVTACAPAYGTTEKPSDVMSSQQQEQYLKAIPQYVYETLQSHNNKPSWYHRISAAKNVRVPILQASEVNLASLLNVTRDVFVINGVLEGCTFPSTPFTLDLFSKELGYYYCDASVMTMEGMQFKCRLSICEALYKLQRWCTCIALESSSITQITAYSPGSIIRNLDWVEKLAEFEKKERLKARENHRIVTPTSILFMIKDSLYDSRYIYAIPNSFLYVHSGVITVYYYPLQGKAGADPNQTASQLLATVPLIMSVRVEAGHYVFIPSGRLFIIQASTDATVIITRFLCGLEMKRQITSYRQLYNDSYDEAFKWQFWKLNWLAAFMYLRALRIAQGVAVEPCSLEDVTISSEEKLTIPFLVVTLKILHEIYGSKQNQLQQFERTISDKAGSLGPLDMLMELATRCRDNKWVDENRQLHQADSMSIASEDTMAVMDVSPYPDSIDSNEFIDSFVEDASIKQEHDEMEKDDPESWEFDCICGKAGHNYDDGKDMVQCSRCYRWCHCECVGYDIVSNADFICRMCK